MKTTTRLKRKAFVLLFAGGTGAALTYYFDPENGEARRGRLSRRVTHATADVVSARRQLADTVDDVAATAGDVDPTVDTTVTDALQAQEPMPDIGGVTTPAPVPPDRPAG